MKIGELYYIKHTWLLPHSNFEFWSTCESMMYIGEDVIDRFDGVTIINHAVLAGGERRIVDRTFLDLLEPLDKKM